MRRPSRSRPTRRSSASSAATPSALLGPCRPDRLGRLDGFGDPRPGRHPDGDLRADGDGAHEAAEWVDLASVERGADVLVAVADEFLRADPSRTGVVSPRPGVRLTSWLEQSGAAASPSAWSSCPSGDSAVSRKDVRLNQLHGADGGRIQQKRVRSVDGEEAPHQEIVKGYEIEPGRYVTITPAELEGVAVEPCGASRSRSSSRSRRSTRSTGSRRLPRARPCRGEAVRPAAGGAREHLARRTPAASSCARRSSLPLSGR